MPQFLQLFIWIPLAGFLFSMLVPRKKESIISGIALTTSGLYVLGIFTLTTVWLAGGSQTLDIKHIVLYKSGTIEIFIDFYFDRITAVFAAVGALLAFLVIVFSKYYLHREEGFKRFFNTLLFFLLGYNLVIFSGNFETLFVGWEILGICSFLLVAFYRDRYLPVKNGLKVISFYRLADICLILAMWMSHHLWHENITFLKLNDSGLVGNHLEQYYSLGIFISAMILITAAIKSAQLPFSSWLPRAMEGPTTSSAIFYGSLSVHLGAFLLLRTFPFWEQLLAIKILVIIIGVATAIIATGIARVQPTVKTQIAYASAAQLGIIFIEIAAGFHLLALIHVAANAFLRTYQLLVSPSVMSYLIHDQFYHFKPRTNTEKQSMSNKIRNSIYILCIKEWNLDFLVQRVLWNPFKWIGKKFDFISTKLTLILVTALFVFGVYCSLSETNFLFNGYLPYVFSFLALMLILKAFTYSSNARHAWLLLSSSQFFIALSIVLTGNFDLVQLILYLSGGIISAVVGYVCLHKIASLEQDIDLNKFHGHTHEYRGLGFVFLLSCLGLVAFPISPAFIGFDLLLTHIEKDQLVLILFTALSFLFLELSALRIYVRIFLGQHKKTYHGMAFRSS
jgi:NADH:ubiquinone oxidoreductase subunit 5 (subunit L)/multisubunit Na+/H+ antiporter MnhA subunit